MIKFFSNNKIVFISINFCLIFLYLFPGSLIGYLLYENFGQQPNLISNPIGTSINHLIFFFYLTTLGLVVRLKYQNFLKQKEIAGQPNFKETYPQETFGNLNGSNTNIPPRTNPSENDLRTTNFVPNPAPLTENESK